MQEKIAKLYLRLNGYFLTSLIIHSSEKGKNATQIDAIGVRFPFHEQKDREIKCSEKLMIPTDKTDIIICEVKDTRCKPKFNDALITSNEALQKLFEWIGVIKGDEIVTAKDTFKKNGKFETDGLQIRPIIFSFNDNINEDILTITGSDTFSYIKGCLIPSNPRDACSTTYPYESCWGDEYESIIRYFKDKNKKGEMVSLEDLYTHLGV